ncbi:uncharacterized protein [Apostichopus japonicus]|uniref:uncharacterized protein n=1 Tax=Stichopus japonicus TaxID=307972 RepID=UPI003AB118A4
MIRIAFCFLLLGVLANAHHGGSHDEDDHHHENSVDATLSPQGVLTVLFHAPSDETFTSVQFEVDGVGTASDDTGEAHGDHFDWSVDFTAGTSGLSQCDEIDVEVTGYFPGGSREEFDGHVDISGPNC